VNDVGPIARARLPLRPLTVVIGPNNAGKSVLATLIYSLTTAQISFSPFAPRLNQHARMPAMPTWSPRALEEFTKEWSSQIVSLLEILTSTQKVTTKALTEGVNSMLSDALTRHLQQYAVRAISECERAFGTPFRDLARFLRADRSSSPSIRVSSSRPQWSVSLTPGERAGYRFTVDQPEYLAAAARHIQDFAKTVLSPNYPIKQLPESFGTQLVVDALNDYCFEEFPNSSFYLPAGRTGFLESHRALASFVVSRAPLVGIEDMAIPKMKGVIGDFIGTLLRLNPTDHGSFSDQASLLERDVLAGGVSLSLDPSGYPEISYRYRGQDLPLHRTSSMISELAPVVLYLRHVVDENGLLIIEEPESHLHPESQLLLAHVLVKLVNVGLRIMLTTHSDYFLRGLNNAIRQGALHPEARGREWLDIRDVAAILCQPSSRHGTVTSRLRVTREDGISEGEFARVAAQLYSETVTLQRQLIAE